MSTDFFSYDDILAFKVIIETPSILLRIIEKMIASFPCKRASVSLAKWQELLQRIGKEVVPR